jgi:hypothetical protein
MNIKPKSVTPNAAHLHTHTHTHTHTHLLQLYSFGLKNVWKSYLWWLLDLLLLSVEFQVLETNEFSQFLSHCNGQQSHAVWYSYNLFHDKKLVHCKGDMTSRICTVGYRGLSAEWHSYKLSEIPNIYHNTLSVLQAQTGTNCTKNMHILISALQIQIYWWQLFRDNDRPRQCLIKETGPDSVWSNRPVQTVYDQTDRSRQCLIKQTGPDSVWSDRPLVELVCKGNAVYERLLTCVGTTDGYHINCAVRAVQHREHSVWYSKQV